MSANVFSLSPLGRGQGEGHAPFTKPRDPVNVACPHPNPLPEGEGARTMGHRT